MKKKSHLIQFRDPNLSDRELLLVMLFQIVSIKSDLKTLTELFLKNHPEFQDEFSKLALFSSKLAFDDYERLIHDFVNRKQNLSEN